MIRYYGKSCIDENIREQTLLGTRVEHIKSNKRLQVQMRHSIILVISVIPSLGEV